MSTPALELRPGDLGYDAVYARWVLDGRPDMIESMRDDCAYRVIRHDDTVVFALAAYLAGVTTLDRSSPISGYGLAMGTWQRSWNGVRQLPK